ncbi:chitin-binding protein, partial [Streptomyces sp. SID5998]|nr:chitin-binding protein [Streptomyces sp. SID5998]
SDPHTGSCMAVYSVTNSWSGGFQGSVEVMNHGTTPLSGWSVAWKPGAGTRIGTAWNGTLTTAADGTVTVTNADYNRVVPPDGSVTFGFTATSTGNDYPIGSIGCVNP